MNAILAYSYNKDIKQLMIFYDLKHLKSVDLLLAPVVELVL